MPNFDKAKAKSRIASIFKRYSTLRATHFASLSAVGDGKLYELYALSQLLRELKRRGFVCSLNGTSIKFKASPGHINPSDPHFDVFAKDSPKPLFEIYTNIEVQTLGSQLTGTHGLCSYHEFDILMVPAGVTGKPTFEDVVLGVECKAQSDFTKDIVRGALGLRREMSYLQPSSISKLSSHQKRNKVQIPAQPPSEIWLAYVDPKGNNYSQSPKAFGIEFKHWQP